LKGVEPGVMHTTPNGIKWSIVPDEQDNHAMCNTVSISV
jgi:hypothetical protein